MDYNDKSQNLKQDVTLRPLSSHVAARLEPIMRKKGGFDLTLLENWPQIVGEQMAQICIPFKINWPRSAAERQTKPATLSIACEGMASLKIQHQADEIIEKINLFFGFHAIGKIKIVQKPSSHMPAMSPLARPLNPDETAWLEKQTRFIADDVLRCSMVRLGENIISTTPLRLKKSNI